MTFACEGETIVATLDDAPGRAGLLFVSGGNEVRSGAFAGQAQLAAEIACAGFPVFRFDRRGVGDSSGQNQGFKGSSSDIAAAIAAFRNACPHVDSIVAFGNCDAAAALMLNSGAGCDALLLANPWTIENDNSTLPPSAIRARYIGKIRNPHELRRLITGKVSLPLLAATLWRALRPPPPLTSLAEDIAAGLAGFEGPVRILLAGRDRTAQAFLSGWDKTDPRLVHCPAASHAFVETEARAWLLEQIFAGLRAA